MNLILESCIISIMTIIYLALMVDNSEKIVFLRPRVPEFVEIQAFSILKRGAYENTAPLFLFSVSFKAVVV